MAGDSGIGGSGSQIGWKPAGEIAQKKLQSTIGSHRTLPDSNPTLGRKVVDNQVAPVPAKVKRQDFSQFAKSTSMEALDKGISEREVQNFLTHVSGFLRTATAPRDGTSSVTDKERGAALLELRKYKETEKFAQEELGKLDFIQVVETRELPVQVRMKALGELEKFPDMRRFAIKEMAQILRSAPTLDRRLELLKKMAPSNKLATDILYKWVERKVNRITEFPDDNYATKADVLKLLSFLREKVDYRAEDACYLISVCELPHTVLPQGKERLQPYDDARQFQVMGTLFMGAMFGSEKCMDLLVEVLGKFPTDQNLDSFASRVRNTVDNLSDAKRKQHEKTLASIIDRRIRQEVNKVGVNDNNEGTLGELMYLYLQLAETKEDRIEGIVQREMALLKETAARRKK